MKGQYNSLKGNPQENIPQLLNGHHHHHKIEQKIYTTNINCNQKPKPLNIRVNTASKRILTRKQASLITTIRNIIAPANYLLIFTVVLYVEKNITSMAMVAQNISTIMLSGSCS